MFARDDLPVGALDIESVAQVRKRTKRQHRFDCPGRIVSRWRREGSRTGGDLRIGRFASAPIRDRHVRYCFFQMAGSRFTGTGVNSVGDAYQDLRFHASWLIEGFDGDKIERMREPEEDGGATVRRGSP